MTRPRIPLAKPLFGPEEVRAVTEVLESGWVMQGPRVEAFESLCAAVMGVRHAVACSSGTAALQLGLWALEIGPGDEVIVPALGFVATAHAVERCGARPVFADVTPETWCVDAALCEAVVTEHTKAAIPVHLYGLPLDLEPFRALGVPLVEDAAGALGSVVAPVGEAAVYSFHPRKIVTMGEGGVLATDRDDLAARVRSMRNQGRRAQAGEAAVGEYEGPGFNFRLTDLQAAVGLCQLERLGELLEARRALARQYRERLADFPLELPPDGPNHAWQAFVVLVKDRDRVIAALAEAGIEAVPGSHAIPALPYYRERYRLEPDDFPHALRVDERSLALPLYPQMTDEEQDRVVRALRAALPG
jgi:perosamine synthetase